MDEQNNANQDLGQMPIPNQTQPVTPVQADMNNISSAGIANDKPANKNQTPLFITIVVAVLLVVAMGGYIIWDTIRDNNTQSPECPACENNCIEESVEDTDNKNDDSQTSTTVEETCSNTTSVYNVRPLDGDISFSFSTQSDTVDDVYLTVSQEDSNNFKTFSYAINKRSGYSVEQIKDGTITLEADARQVMLGGSGQDPYGEAIVFVLANGNVQYIPLSEVFDNSKVVLKKLENVKDVILATSVNVFDGHSGYYSTLLWRADGGYYNFAKQLNA